MELLINKRTMTLERSTGIVRLKNIWGEKAKRSTKKSTISGHTNILIIPHKHFNQASATLQKKSTLVDRPFHGYDTSLKNPFIT